MAITRPDVLGQGWAFPFRFSSVGRVRKIVGVTPASSLEKIKMAIRQILGTRIGSRVIDREWGSDLREIIFEPIDEVAATSLRLAITEALQTWERRITMLNVSISIDRAIEGVLDAEVIFRVNATQQQGNLVFPFYITPDMRVQNQITVG